MNLYTRISLFFQSINCCDSSDIYLSKKELNFSENLLTRERSSGSVHVKTGNASQLSRVNFLSLATIETFEGFEDKYGKEPSHHRTKAISELPEENEISLDSIGLR